IDKVKKKLSLLQQAFAEEKRMRIEKLKNLFKREAKPTDVLAELLPKYEPTKKQKKFHNSDSYEKGLKGGYGAGKTMPLCVEAVYLSYVNRPLSIVVSSPTDDNIALTTYETIKNLLRNNDVEYVWTKDDGHFEILWGQTDEEHGHIYLIGQVFFKGPNVAAVGFDEPFSQRKETYDNLIARARNPKAKRLEVFWAGTAEPAKMEWGFEYFERDHDSPDLFTVTIATEENPHLPKGFVDSLKKRFSAKLQEVYLKGKLVLLSNVPVYDTFDRTKNVLQLKDYKITRLQDYQELILSFDFNVDPMTCVMVGVGDRRFYQLKEWAIHSSNTKELCGAVIAYLLSTQDSGLSNQKSIVVTGDATGRRRGTRHTMSDYEIIRDEFEKAGIKIYFNVPTENPPVRDRVNFVNKLFEAEQFFIDESCLKSIKDRELVSWKQSGEGFIVDKSKKDLTHLSDCGDYAVYNNQILLDDEETSYVYVGQRQRR
ncbi:hypothetical protein IT397_00600, partial [Candidatus Nomurabacteria bacterium]|nr:hypothetical protein [Candidatus Nomurabacteria bacterium]